MDRIGRTMSWTGPVGIGVFLIGLGSLLKGVSKIQKSFSRKHKK